MKIYIRHLFFLFAVAAIQNVFSQPKVNFEPANDYVGAMQKSKVSDKPLFVMVHAEWCSHCNKMKSEVLTDKDVAEFLNSHFINLMIDIESPEGIAFSKKFDVASFPTFVFLDEHQAVLYKLNGEYKLEEFATEIKNATNPKMQLPFLEEKFYADVTNTQNCLDYINVLKKGKNREKIGHVANAYLATVKPSGYATEANWRIIASGINDFNAPIFQYVLSHQSDFAAVASQKRVQNKILNVVTMMQGPAIEKLDTIAFEKNRVLARSVHLTRLDSLNFRLDLQMYEKAKDWKRYRQTTMESVKAQTWNDQKTLNEISKNYAAYFADKADLETAISWEKRALELNDSHESNLLIARLYNKINDKKLALEYAQKSKAIIEKLGFDEKEVNAFIEKIQRQPDK